VNYSVVMSSLRGVELPPPRPPPRVTASQNSCPVSHHCLLIPITLTVYRLQPSLTQRICILYRRQSHKCTFPDAWILACLPCYPVDFGRVTSPSIQCKPPRLMICTENLRTIPGWGKIREPIQIVKERHRE